MVADLWHSQNHLRLNRCQQASLSVVDQTLHVFRYERHDALDLEAAAEHGIDGSGDRVPHVAEALLELTNKSAMLVHNVRNDQISRDPCKNRLK